MGACFGAAEEGEAVSVLIKGMKMPTHCTECDFWHDGVFEHCLLNMKVQNEDVPFNEGEYPDGCPLIEVQPHGRLIDANEFLKRAIGTKCFRGDYALMLEKLVGESATIIPASDKDINVLGKEEGE